MGYSCDSCHDLSFIQSPLIVTIMHLPQTNTKLFLLPSFVSQESQFHCTEVAPMLLNEVLLDANKS